jgi:hypothetical protein
VKTAQRSVCRSITLNGPYRSAKRAGTMRPNVLLSVSKLLLHQNEQWK